MVLLLQTQLRRLRQHRKVNKRRLLNMTIYLSLAQASPPSFAGVLDGKSESVVATGGYVSLLADILTLLASPPVLPRL